MIFDDEKLIRMLKDAPNGSEVKIFYFIAHNQPIDGIRGFQTTKIQLAYDLGLKMPTIFRSLHWLEENILINEIKQVETIDFMANPYFVMNNSTREERIKEWNRRCDIARDKKIAARKRKRLRELKNAAKQ